MKKHAAVLAGLIGAACAQQPPPPTTPAPAAAAIAPPAQVATAPLAPEKSDAQVAPGRWDVARVRCSDVLGASDEDRAASMMFYYGYLAAKANIRVIDVSKMEGNIRKVVDQCTAEPAITVPLAFRRALRPQHS